jgi:hypothetical protein
MTADDFHEALSKELGKPFRRSAMRVAGRFVIREPPQEHAGHPPWALATISLQTHQIKAQVNLDIERSGLAEAQYARLRNLVFRGIRRFWSRTVHVGGEAFSVDVNAMSALGNAISVSLAVQGGSNYARSHNVGLLGIEATLFYNIGSFATQAEADADFMQTAAHEVGHSILKEFGGVQYSWSHKGSTSLLQSVKDTTPGYPPTGEVDLMRYYDESKTPGVSFARLAARTMADEWDVKCLLWLSRLTF